MSKASKGVLSIEAQCEKAGLRMTEQRRVIARVLDDSNHPDVEAVHREVAKQNKRISLATVYRTVRLFVEHGILQQLNFQTQTGEPRARYEPSGSEHHDHLIDLETGKVLEFTNEDIEKLQEQVAEKMGYRLVDHRLELYAVPLKSKKTQK